MYYSPLELTPGIPRHCVQCVNPCIDRPRGPEGRRNGNTV